MKVTMIAREYPPNVYGGAGVHLRELSRCLSKLMDVEVRYFGDVSSESPHLMVKGYMPWSHLDCKMQPKFNSIFKTFSTNLEMLCDGIDSQIVHTHTWYGHFAGYLAKILYAVPFVATCHSLEPFRPWKVHQLGKGYEVSTWMEKIGIEGADKVIAVSKIMKEDILKYFNIKSDRIEVIHNGIDLDIWKQKEMDPELRKRYGIEDDYILFIGRPTAQKGMRFLIDAMEYIPCQLVMGAVGADTKEYEDLMMEKVKNNKKIVWIHEHLKEEEYIQLYTSAKVFVCPSMYEPFGIINLEAMSCKTPVVANAVGGILEVVAHEETGLLVEPANPRKMADAVNRLLKDPVMARTLGENGRRRVEELFGWDRIADQTKKLYEKLVWSADAMLQKQHI
ncbi:MAG: glycogen synthase [Candidatus Aureabacteria bacterium]|nr:glycogen synthase [Candidatus Auribacterota bacterium]